MNGGKYTVFLNTLCIMVVLMFCVSFMFNLNFSSYTELYAISFICRQKESMTLSRDRSFFFNFVLWKYVVSKKKRLREFRDINAFFWPENGF